MITENKIFGEHFTNCIVKGKYNQMKMDRNCNG